MAALQTIEKLKEYGLSEYRISKRCIERGTPVSQSTVNRLATGETKDCRHSTALALEALLAEIIAALPKSRSSRRATAALSA